jgi:hypothetical protein
MDTAERLAQRFHDTYERLAPSYGWETQRESAVEWTDVPQRNRDLMIAVVREITDELKQQVFAALNPPAGLPESGEETP